MPHHLPNLYAYQLSKHLALAAPALIKHSPDDKPNFFQWSPEYLLQTIGDKYVWIAHSIDGLFRVNPKGFSMKDEWIEMQFSIFLQQIKQHNAETKSLYLIHTSIPTNFPELMTEFTTPHYVDQERLRHINLWVGQKGNVSPLHFDTNNNVLCEIYGRKKILLYPPEQKKYLYPYSCLTKAAYVSPIRADKPDFKLYPKFAQAKAIEIILNPGDIMYIPPFWWHQVYNLDMTISVNFWWRLYQKQYWQRSYARMMTNQIFIRMKDMASRINE